MDLGKTISYNGFSFSVGPLSAATPGRPVSGVVIERIEPTPIDAVGYIDKKALDDGVDAFDTFLGQRPFTIHASVYGTSEGQVWDSYDDLVTAFTPTIAYSVDTANLGFLALLFTRQTADTATWPSGIPLQAYVRATRPPIYGVLRRKQQGHGVGGQLPVVIPMLARDPRYYLQTEQSISISPSSATATATHRGTYPVWPTIRFTITGAGASNARFFVGAQFVQLNLTTHTGTDTLDLNYAKRNLTKTSDGTPTFNKHFTAFLTSVFNKIQPGGTSVYVTNTTNLSAISYKYREAWL